MTFHEQIEELRKKINSIDDQLLELLSRRANLAREVGMLKRQNQVEAFAADRERKIHERLENGNRGPLSNEDIRSIFREIISACLSLEKPLQIAYLGPEGTFAHQAALNQFGHSPQLVQIPTIEGIFAEVERQRSDYGVVPIENSNEGSVDRTLDMFIETPLSICGEISLPVSHYLLSRAEETEDIERIYSHPQALSQCSRWLANNLPDVPVEPVSSTAVAAKKAFENPRAAAIASKVSAPIYNLKILKERIEDYPNNFTRFWIIGQKSPEKSGHDKTTIMFSVKDEVGALYQALYPFFEYKINMTKIESRPSKERPWEYVFFADLAGHATDPDLKSSLEEIRKLVNFLKVLGSYPRAV